MNITDFISIVGGFMLCSLCFGCVFYLILEEMEDDDE